MKTFLSSAGLRIPAHRNSHEKNGALAAELLIFVAKIFGNVIKKEHSLIDAQQPRFKCKETPRVKLLGFFSTFFWQ